MRSLAQPCHSEIFLFFKLMLYCMNDNSDDLGGVFDEHVKCEFVTKDIEATMTMVKEPCIMYQF
jgi:hypothetical protein